MMGGGSDVLNRVYTVPVNDLRMYTKEDNTVADNYKGVS